MTVHVSFNNTTGLPELVNAPAGFVLTSVRIEFDTDPHTQQLLVGSGKAVVKVRQDPTSNKTTEMTLPFK
ncbi:hypothetical protein [Massilia putida]|uniref:hypothetical protein n=1 Tax=Massilia putida TaxID=1141883 RepID=UPI00095164EA|nr:hypothetical protein [Massilia putida]